MNFKKSALASAITLATFATGAAAFDASSWEVSGFVKNETAFLQKDGTFNGQSTGPTDTTQYNDQGDVIKFENTLKLFVNGALGENADLHAELNFVADPEAKGSHFETHDDYSQTDYLRELYVDSVFGENSDVELRIGKQQVVWGTADGAKLLDIINPTDYREMAQNTMEDSRIPVWMAKLDMAAGDNGNLQLIASQARENVFAGLNRNIDTRVRNNGTVNNNDSTTDYGLDQGSPYILKGVDSITGKRYGFVNIVPDLASVAGDFYSAYKQNLAPNTTKVVTFATSSDTSGFGFSGNGSSVLDGFAADYDAVLNVSADHTTWGDVKDSPFEYMDQATFGTFDTFAFAKSQYLFNMPDDFDLDLAGRYKASLDNGVNFSVNYAYAYDKNPIINMTWVNDSGEALKKSIDSNNTITLTNQAGTVSYGAKAADYANGSDYLGTYDSSLFPTLRFEQTVERAHNLGASFDYTIDTQKLGGVVVRGEFLYTKDAYQPVMDLGRLGIGDLADALTMHKADRFKYVLGADITVFTNMLVSAQFIQDRNLDYVDTTSDYLGRARYTADYATMHMTNGFNKAKENKEFYSLFLSKPFGPNQLGRWNNITMYEEGDGWWNRFDVEYSFTDEMIGTFELNNYWGDANTQFGQLEDASNVQVGFKYLF